jgi:galactose-1-phosphate uridylyltransferase
VKFRKIIKNVKLLNPLNGFRLEAQPIEYRKDPLTGLWCRINIKRAERVKQARLSPPAQDDDGQVQKASEDLRAMIDKTKERCFFCAENIERDTPKFSEDIWPRFIGAKYSKRSKRPIWKEGRLQMGQCLVFPNLFPFGQYHAVAIMSSQHYLALDGFTDQMVIDNLTACRDYILAVYRNNPMARFPMYNWNHMPPSAASIVHPHVQVLIDREPTSYEALLLKSSKEYCIKTGRNYWEEIVEEEQRLGQRFIHRDESLSCIASFAPQGNREVQIIFTGISSIAQLDKRRIADFSRCVIKILRSYKDMGVGSFNLSSFSGPINEPLEYYSLNLKIISRPSLQAYWTNDTGFMERFQYESIVEQKPEDVAAGMRRFLKFGDPPAIISGSG